MKTLFFGSIGTLVESSEIQRSCFNNAFAAHGLDWHWTRETYQKMLKVPGGIGHIRAYAQTTGETVDALAIHNLKSAQFQKALDQGTIDPRAGVVETLQAAKEEGVKVGLVSTTLRRNVEQVLAIVGRKIDRGMFDVITTIDDVSEPKPKPEVYKYALQQLGADPRDTVAIEDNLGGVHAAMDANMRCIAFPGFNTQDHDYSQSTKQFDRALEPAAVLSVLA